jgi:hypothetical protein
MDINVVRHIRSIDLQLTERGGGWRDETKGIEFVVTRFGEKRSNDRINKIVGKPHRRVTGKKALTNRNYLREMMTNGKQHPKENSIQQKTTAYRIQHLKQKQHPIEDSIKQKKESNRNCLFIRKQYIIEDSVQQKKSIKQETKSKRKQHLSENSS